MKQLPHTCRIQLYAKSHTSRLILLALRHLVHQSCHHVVHPIFFHRYRLDDGKQVFVPFRQTLEQCYDNIFNSHKYIQTNKLISERPYLVDVVQHVVTLLHLTCEKLVTNEIGVGQILRLVNAANGLLRLCRSFAIFNVPELVIRQVEADHEYDHFDTSLVSLRHFRICIRRWSFLVSMHNVLKIHNANNILILNFQILKFPQLNLSMALATSLWNDTLLYSDIYQNVRTSFSWLEVNPTQNYKITSYIQNMYSYLDVVETCLYTFKWISWSIDC